MFVGITNEARNYPWGSLTAIAELLGTAASGKPEAEVWLGAHAGSPARILNPAVTNGADTLYDWIAAEPARALGNNGDGSSVEDARLPFLMKVLAAASPLSLQAHPTREQAKAGFARENAAGVPADAPFRNYKDAYPKPELMLALSDTFEALCGFRSPTATQASLDLLLAVVPEADQTPILGLRARLDDENALPETFEWLISRGDGVDALISSVELAAARAREAGDGSPEFETVLSLAEQYPGDPGIVISLLINRVSLKRGEVLYLPAGNIHAYLFGLGIEVMASSDNVMRGGLTTKHVDVPELLGVLDFTPLPVPYLTPTEIAPGVAQYRPDVPDFVLVHAKGEAIEASYPLAGPAIALCLSGTFDLSGALGSTTLTRGESVYITADEAALGMQGQGELVVATVGA